MPQKLPIYTTDFVKVEALNDSWLSACMKWKDSIPAMFSMHTRHYAGSFFWYRFKSKLNRIMQTVCCTFHCSMCTLLSCWHCSQVLCVAPAFALCVLIQKCAKYIFLGSLNAAHCLIRATVLNGRLLLFSYYYRLKYVCRRVSVEFVVQVWFE